MNDTAAMHFTEPENLFRSFGSVLGPPLSAVLNSKGVERPSDNVVAHTGKVFDPAAAHQHHRVLLEVVPDAGDVSRHLDPGRKPNARHLSKRGVGFFGVDV
jgi:hypothetical protein